MGIPFLVAILVELGFWVRVDILYTQTPQGAMSQPSTNPDRALEFTGVWLIAT